MLTDTHAHFDLMLAAGESLDAIIARAAQAGVSRMLAVGGAPEANRRALEITRAFPERIRAAVGFNRDQAAVIGQAPEELEAMLAAPEAAAIGEIGLDFHRGLENAPAQIKLFRRMLELARDRSLPVCVHTREAEAETLAALREHAAGWRGAPDCIGVLHCFTGGADFARKLLALGFCVSFSGIVTFKNSESLRAAAAIVPDDRLLIETDSPFLAPEPLRGRPNEPANVRRVAQVLAEIRQTSLETIASITTNNARRLFRG